MPIETRQMRIVPTGGMGSVYFSQNLIEVPANVANVDLAIFRADIVGNADGMQLPANVLPGFTLNGIGNFFFQTTSGEGVGSYTLNPGETSEIMRLGNFSGVEAGDSIDLFWSGGPNPNLTNAQAAPGNGVDQFSQVRIEFI